MVRKVSATQDLAVYLWKDIQGKTEPPFSDPVFVRRYMSAAKKILKLEGIEVQIVKYAMRLMKKAGIKVYSPQQAIDWSNRKGQSYYELARLEMDKRNVPPPVYEAAAYAEWLIHMGRGDELEEVFKVRDGSEME